jgi:hypothetical protein
MSESKINEDAADIKNKNTRDFYRSRKEFKKDYQPRTMMV